MSKSRRFCYTVNNYTDDDEARIKDIDAKYIVYGKEVCPTTGTPHIHVFIIFRNPVVWNTAKRLVAERSHIEATKGTSEEAADYCKKDGIFWEKGVCPMEAGKREKKRWEDCKLAAQEGRFDDIPADIYIRFLGNIKKIHAESQKIPEPINELDFSWYYGPTGTGKSTRARQDNPDYYLKGINKWWDGYTDQKCVIIEEWAPMDPNIERGMGHYLKQWCDHHPFMAETKGGMKMIRPPRIIITSNYSLEDCFKDPQLLEPLKRRLKVHHFNNYFAAPTPHADTYWSHNPIDFLFPPVSPTQEIENSV